MLVRYYKGFLNDQQVQVESINLPLWVFHRGGFVVFIAITRRFTKLVRDLAKCRGKYCYCSGLNTAAKCS